MTNEQLDEIEKLAEAWRDAEKRGYSRLDCEYAVHQFLRAMREHALPLVKALREARAALDEREGDMHARIRAGYDKTVADMWRTHCARIEKERDAARNYAENRNDEANKLQRFLNMAAQERDEARAEMDEFAVAVGYGERPEGQSGVHRLSGEQLAERWKQIERERDEAQAELKERQETLEQAVAERASALAERNWANERYHEARAEVERLREAARQVHALASVLVIDWDPRRVNQAVHEIHALTKGMVAP